MSFDYLQNTALGSYVYVLRDPRNKEVFYVGKAGGKNASGNERVLDHFAEAEACGVDPSRPRSEKVSRILEIQKSGQSVEWFVIRRSLRDEEEAFHVEAALIDLLRVSSCGPLLNQQSGHGHDEKGLLTQEEVSLLAAKDIDLVGVPKDLIGVQIFLFNIGWGLKERGNPYEATRRAWRLGSKFANTESGPQFAVGIVEGVSRGAWKINSWNRDQVLERRWAFEGSELNADCMNFLFPKNFSKIIGHSSLQGAWRRGGGVCSIRFDGHGQITILRGSKEKYLELTFVQ